MQTQKKTTLTKTQPYHYNQAIWTNSLMICTEQVFAKRKILSLCVHLWEIVCTQKVRLFSLDGLCGCTQTLLACFVFYESALFFPHKKTVLTFSLLYNIHVYLLCSEGTFSKLLKVDARGDSVEEMRGHHCHVSAHKRNGKHTSMWMQTCFELHKSVTIRKREGERKEDCSTKEARERANQWRHDNELFPH